MDIINVDISTNDDVHEFLDYQLNQTTADIERNHFYGELSDVLIPPTSYPIIKSPAYYKIINGKPLIKINNTPPKAKLPNYDSRFFKIT